MKTWWMVALCVGCAALGWADAGETLALTVHTKNADPGEEGVDLLEQYYSDESGRLIREVVTRRGEFDGDPNIVEETSFQWNGTSVRWEKKDAKFRFLYSIDRQGDELVYHLSATSLTALNKDFVQDKRVYYTDGPRTQWEDGTYRYSWSLANGFQQYFLNPDPTTGTGSPILTTVGSRISGWYRDRENFRVLLDRTPTRLTGTYVMQNEELNGWVVTGESQVWGAGLFSLDRLTNLTHAILLHTDVDPPFWAPFVFEKNYLH